MKVEHCSKVMFPLIGKVLFFLFVCLLWGVVGGNHK